MIDYEEFSSAVGLNWYEVDPNLQQTMRRMLAPQDLEWAEPELYRLGALIGGKVAASAEVIDKNPPRLVQYDRSGGRIPPCSPPRSTTCWRKRTPGCCARSE